MAGFGSVANMLSAYDAGQTAFFTWRKVPTQTTASGIWFDLSMSPGNPIPNYYAAAPLVAKRLAQSTDVGIFHGAAPAAASKYLRRLTVITTTTTAVPLPMILCDYLLYYPFIDMSVTDAQLMVQTESLSRHATGAGVNMVAVEVASQIGGSTFQVTYTNQDGTEGRTTPIITCNTQVSTGTIISTAPATNGTSGPFLPLQAGDTGVRKIESVTFITGDVGLITLVLVKPLASISVHDITAPVERDFLVDGISMPLIQDDAYLNFLVYPSGTLASAQIIGTAEFIWN